MRSFSARVCSAVCAVRRMSSAAQGGGGGGGSGTSFKNQDTRPQETFFGLPPPGFDATTHFGFQTVAQELKEGLVAQVRAVVITKRSYRTHAQRMPRHAYASGVPQSCRQIRRDERPYVRRHAQVSAYHTACIPRDSSCTPGCGRTPSCPLWPLSQAVRFSTLLAAPATFHFAF
jgi:hypothetical protein